MAETDLLVRIRAVLDVDKASGTKISEALKQDIRSTFATLKEEAAAAKSTVGAERSTGTALESAGSARAAINTLRDEGKITQRMFDELSNLIDRQVADFNKQLQTTIAANSRIKPVGAITQQQVQQQARTVASTGKITTGGDLSELDESLAAKMLAGAQASAEALAELAAAGSGYAEALATSSLAQAEIKAQEQAILAAIPAYAESLASSAVSQAQIKAEQQAILASIPAYAESLAASAVSQASINAQQQAILATIPEYAQSLAQAAISQAQIKASQQSILASSPAYAEALAQSTVSQKVIAGQEAQVITSNQAYVEAIAQAAVQKKLLTAAEQQATAAALDEAAIRKIATGEASKRLSAAQIQQATIATPQFAQAVEIEAANKAVKGAIEKRAVSELSAAVEAEASVANGKAQLSLERRRIIELTYLLGLDEAEAAAKAQSLKGETQIARLKAERVALEERLAAQTAAAGGKPPPGSRPGGINFAGGFKSTLKYGLPSIALFGALRGITDAVKESAELERIFNQINRQFESFEETGKALPGDFERFRLEILSIARDTGQAASEVANVGFQLQGAFGGDTTKTLGETRSAIEAVRVTGLELTEVIDAFTALTQNFTKADVTIEKISDTALGLQERFGVLAKETISFASDLAPVAASAGFAVHELEALGAVAQKYSGRTGTSLAEAYGRIIPQIQQNAAKFLQFFEGIPALAASAGDLAAAFRGGDILGVIELLGQGYSKLSSAQQNYVAELLGGRREAQAIIGVLEHFSELQSELDKGFIDAGKTADYYNDLQETLAQKLARVGEEFKQLGVKIYNGALKDFLSDLLTLGSSLVDVLSIVVDLVSTIAGIGGGGVGTVLGSLLEGAALFYGGRALVRGAGNLLGGGKLGGLFGGAAKTGTTLEAGTVALGGAGLLSKAGIGAKLAGARAAISSIPTIAAEAGTAIRTGGAVFGTSLTAAASAIPWTAAGVALAVGIEGLSSKLLTDANKHTQKLLGPDLRVGGNEFDIITRDALPDTTGKELRDRIDRFFANGGEDFEELQRSINESVESGTSLFQYSLDILPGNLSPDTNKKKSDIDALLKDLQVKYAETLAVAAESGPLLDEFLKVVSGSTGKFVDVIDESLSAGEQTQQAKDVIAGAIQRLSEGKGTALDRELAILVGQLGPLAEKVVQQRIDEAQQLEFLQSGEAQSLFEAGKLSFVRYKATLQDEIRRLQSVDTGTPDEGSAIAALQEQLAGLISEQTLKAIESLAGLDEIRGNVSPQVNIDRYVGALNSGKLDTAGRKEATQQIVSLLNDLQQFQIDQADSIEEQIKIYEDGIQIPEPVRIELLSEALVTTNEGFQTLLDNLFGSFTEDASKFAREVAAIQIQTGKDLQQAAIMAINARIKALQILAAAQARLSQLFFASNIPGGSFLGGSLTPPTSGATEDQIRKLQAQIQAILSAPLTGGNISVPTTTGADAGRAADLRKQQAEEAKRAAEEAERAAQELRDAQFEYALALIENDPFKAAQAAQQKAQNALFYAKTEADRLNAQAERIRADRQFHEAIDEIMNSRIELLIAFADAAGDTVKSAQLSLDLARQQLSQIQAIGGGEAAINAAKGDVARQEAAVRDAMLNDTRDHYQFLYDVGRISTQQFVNYLQSLLLIPDLTEQQIQDIQRQIYGLRQQLASDLQFNIPDIQLPTLYEVRRLMGTQEQANAGTSSGFYQDSRQISVTLNVSENVDVEPVMNQLAQLLDAPAVTGIYPRNY